LKTVFEIILCYCFYTLLSRYAFGGYAEMISMDVNLIVNMTVKLMRRRRDAAVPMMIREVESEDEDGET
jgi:hypothetical protein